MFVEVSAHHTKEEPKASGLGRKGKEETGEGQGCSWTGSSSASCVFRLTLAICMTVGHARRSKGKLKNHFWKGNVKLQPFALETSL